MYLPDDVFAVIMEFYNWDLLIETLEMNVSQWFLKSEGGKWKKGYPLMCRIECLLHSIKSDNDLRLIYEGYQLFHEITALNIDGFDLLRDLFNYKLNVILNDV